MAPSQLNTSSPRPLGLINDAISSAASPLQANFQLSCRSPVRPTHDVGTSAGTSASGGAGAAGSRPHRGSARHALSLSPNNAAASAFLVPPLRHFGPLPSPSRRTWPTLPEDGSSQDTVVDDDDEADDFDTVNDRSWFLPRSPPTPGVAPFNRFSHAHARDDDDTKLGVVSAVNIIVGKTIGVGAYSVPSAIFEGVGSVGMALLVWAVGSLISFCGLAVYLDLGTALPRSGGERVYLERIFRRPRMLATCMFMAYVVLLGFSTPNAIVLGEYALYALGVPMNRWNVRAIAVVSVTVLCSVHAWQPRLGLKLINVLGAVKMLMLVVVVVSGVAGGIMGVGSDPARTPTTTNSTAAAIGMVTGRQLDAGISTARRNFQDIWAGSSSQPYDYATALLKVIYCFRGYSTANQVLSDVRDPVRTLRVAAPLALVLVSLSYLAVNVAFFLVVDKDAFRSAGVVVAGVFFRNVFGDGVGARVLPIFVIISAAGNIAATSFAQARVNEELAKDGLLPFASFWRSGDKKDKKVVMDTMGTMETPTNPTPSRGLLLHWLVSVLVIVVPPPGKIYNFLVDIGGYPVSVISVAIAAGLLYLHSTPSERWASPWPAPRLAIIVFATSNCLLLVLPWIPPVGGRGESERFASYAYPTTALAVIASGALFWLWWRYRGLGRISAEASSVGTRRRHDSRTSRNSPPGWDRMKFGMSKVGVQNSSSEGSSSSSSSPKAEEDGDDDGDHSVHDPLLEDNDTGSSPPVNTSTTVRRRAPCGCPSPD
ncbi:hypothetical protein SPBR_05671 [Sporothrix brasiliensis 5110]|uniref:High affinity methionine permease n=1 Tax=Sporothrix brasiliensis 5110 TaxID=1398154 RepID=A0A0C2J6J9_9PEZI|nr:uncharacterized protein SPBR_05671 [Sporothrix brasiliensis 5110]KIH94600.1 hypothetical protein SPBR_05671 [Sporothrix brasiliensis 5110]